jgi:ribonuclease-3
VSRRPHGRQDPDERARARERRLGALQDLIGYRFSERRLLEQALTHASRANEDASGSVLDNEPLEFLGDSVLGFLVSDRLHQRNPEGDEGAKTRTRAHLVSTRSLAERSAAIGLPALLDLGRGEEKTGGRDKQSLWADAYEALIAAIYLDGGLDSAREFVTSQFERDLDTAGVDRRDHKSALQEFLQARGQPPPDYVVVAEEGPSHRRRYRVACRISELPDAEGLGYSKKEAQQAAARDALKRLRRGAGRRAEA